MDGLENPIKIDLGVTLFLETPISPQLSSWWLSHPFEEKNKLVRLDHIPPQSCGKN